MQQNKEKKKQHRFSRVKCHVECGTGTSHVLQLKVPILDHVSWPRPDDAARCRVADAVHHERDADVRPRGGRHDARPARGSLGRELGDAASPGAARVGRALH